MSDWVRVFIKDQLTNIDEHDWNTVFKEWYNNVSIDEQGKVEAEQFQELITALRQCGIEDTLHLASRKTVLWNALDNIINDWLSNNYNRVDDWKIYWESIINELYSYLGLTKEEIFDMLANYDEYGIEADPKHKCFNIEGM